MLNFRYCALPGHPSRILYVQEQRWTTFELNDRVMEEVAYHWNSETAVCCISQGTCKRMAGLTRSVTPQLPARKSKHLTYDDWRRKTADNVKHQLIKAKRFQFLFQYLDLSWILNPEIISKEQNASYQTIKKCCIEFRHQGWIVVKIHLRVSFRLQMHVILFASRWQSICMRRRKLCSARLTIQTLLKFKCNSS